MPTTTEKTPAEQQITAAADLSSELAHERIALRGFAPGDPERERRIKAALDRQLVGSHEVQSFMARSRWDDSLLTAEQYGRLGKLSAELSRHRRQLKKMRR